MSEEELIHCTSSTEASLYLAYMPFVARCGLFVRTLKEYQLGDLVRLSVKLMDEPDLYLMEAKVVWITPKGAQGNKPAGIGVQLVDENSRNFCNKIETYLAGMLKSSKITDTL